MDRDDTPLVMAGSNKDHWDVREKGGLRKCSYCGSVHPEDFIANLKAGDELGVTDKNYKAYLEHGPGMNKFYYQHMNEDQQKEFVDMCNNHVVHFGYPGRFTVLPFFIQIGGDE
jgi:hypothetical protein